MQPLLEISNLCVDFILEKSVTRAVDGLSLRLSPGETLGLVGESGSGKSVTSLAIMGLLNSPGQISEGEILLDHQNLCELPESQMRKIRGNRISMIFQEPMTSLNPVFTVGYQIIEALRLHQKMNRRQALERTIELLDEVGISDPKNRVQAYPHEMSGGQRQRIMIAMAIACQPSLMIADEPTTALDVTIQRQILDLLQKVQRDHSMSLLFITHDLDVIAQMADRMVVMHEGKVVEKGSRDQIFHKPQHPYTKGLLACRPRLDQKVSRLPTLSDFLSEPEQNSNPTLDGGTEPKSERTSSSQRLILEVKNLKKYYPQKNSWWGSSKNWIKAVDDVSLKVFKGKTLGLVGESGCGKTTLGRTLLRLIEPTDGSIYFDGLEITKLNESSMRPVRKKLQIIFQDPYASLNPRMTVGKAIMEPMEIHGLASSSSECKEKAESLLARVGLNPQWLTRFPHEFSGGQRQRVCIARALAVEPEFIVCDESVSALDVSIQAQILNLLIDLQEEFGLTYIFISHDLGVVKFISDQVAVMKDGKIIETADSEEIYQNPKTDYTKKLLAAIPGPPLR